MNVRWPVWPAAALMLGIGGFGFSSVLSRESASTLILYGNTGGYLAPCGCTKPMSGGIVRALAVIRELREQAGGTATCLINGSLVTDSGVQDDFKAECYAEAAGSTKAVLGYGVEEAALGRGTELEMAGLSNGRIVQSQMASDAIGFPITFFRSGAFLLASVTRFPEQLSSQLGAESRTEGAAIKELLEESQGLIPVLCTDGDESEARAIAVSHPGLGLIIYRSTSAPPEEPLRIGTTLLVSEGYHGKYVISLTFGGGHLLQYHVVALGPDVPDDPEGARIYARYLKRVDAAHLLAAFPRQKSATYAGALSCARCHQTAYATWASSGHARAYHDLQVRGHGQDPDCVRCHVVGLASTAGFKSFDETPNLANVGCEDCHGPAQEHALHPRRYRLAEGSAHECRGCHTPDNSPGFDFKTYWPKVKHG